jgi:hypothetical protein
VQRPDRRLMLQRVVLHLGVPVRVVGLARGGDKRHRARAESSSLIFLTCYAYMLLFLLLLCAALCYRMS